MTELFDTHAHLDFSWFDRDREEVLDRARHQGVKYIITIGAGGGPENMENALRLAEGKENMWATAGVHPHDARHMDENVIQRIRSLAAHPKVVAIGEIGLDYAKEYSPRKEQLHAFRDQMKLARELDLPVVIHDRDAHEDVMDVLKKDGAGEAGGIMHCYSGNAGLALRFIEMGFYISFPGVITFKNALNLHETAGAVPAEKILIETDCPFLAPQQYRGKRNEPAYVKLVAEKIAEIRGTSYEEIARQTTANAIRAFRLTPA